MSHRDPFVVILTLFNFFAMLIGDAIFGWCFWHIDHHLQIALAWMTIWNGAFVSCYGIVLVQEMGSRSSRVHGRLE